MGEPTREEKYHTCFTHIRWVIKKCVSMKVIADVIQRHYNHHDTAEADGSIQFERF